MSDELFPVEVVAMDSPRLAWIKKHRLFTHKSEHCEPVKWCAWWDYSDPLEFIEEHGDPERMGYGATEDEALVDVAKKLGLRLWNEEGA